VLLPALPRTPTGKVDRRALPRPGRSRPILDTPYAAPRTAVEAALARLWADVLGVEPVGIHDPFLELGGDSLMATRLLSRVRDATRAELTPAAFLRAPTVAGLAQAIASYRSDRSGSSST
jgi:acyl carrier protein